MANELQFQKDVVLKYFLDKVEGLGYKEVLASTIGENLLVDEDVIEFLQSSQNKENYKLALKDYKGDEKEFHQAYLRHIEEQAYRRQCTSFFFRDGSTNFTTPNGNVYKFIVFNTSDSTLKGDDFFQENIFSITQEYTYKFKLNENNIPLTKRPDLILFLNGVYFDMIQLKVNRQTARKDGREQVINDYIQAVDELTNFEYDTELRNSFLKIYEKAIHITAIDRDSCYVMRAISSYFTEVQRFTGKASKMEIKQKIMKTFKYLPYQKQKRESQNYKEILKTLYGKKEIEKEIIYYNIIKKDYIKTKTGIKKKTTAPGFHMAPRPNQKFAVDSIVSRIKELYDHEKDDDFILKELEKQLDSHSLNQISPDKKEEILSNRRKQNNNRTLYSILGQYSAGFGKTNIMCWLSLVLKDQLRDNDFLFDRIMLITDRVDLRDQLDLNMNNMNIDKTLFQEANTKADLKKFLKDKRTRIIIVNVQKFPFIKDVFDDTMKKALKKERVCFIIDEIHRSQSGVQHYEMSNLFDEVIDAMSGERREKKNTIIGLTATPSDEALIRYGEYNSCIDSDVQWRPFDAFTMREAIDEGFVLNPLKNIIPVAVKMEFDEIEMEEALQFEAPSKQDIYENTSRIEAIGKTAVKFCLDSTFRKIKGRGKAMFKAYSIEAAKKYKDVIEEELAIQLENKKYSAYKDTKVYIVYSNSQKHQKAESLNDNKSEKKVISEFKNCKNAIMIVVDKLQTGFDEPTLHTIFLDAEIKGINAVQTVCRVNRTAKGKNDCAVVDFSHNNVNMKNIQKAFKKYEHMNFASFDVPAFVKKITLSYEAFIKNRLLKNLHSEFLKTIDAEADQKYNEYVKNACNEDELYGLISKGIEYMEDADKGRALLDPSALPNILLDYRSKKYHKLIERLSRVYSSYSHNDYDEEKQMVDFWYDNVMSETDYDEYEEILEDRSGGGGEFTEADPYGIVEKLKALNESEDKKLEIIKKFQLKRNKVFDKMLNLDSDERVKKILLDDNQIVDEMEKEFNHLFKKAKRRMKKESELDSIFWSVAESALIHIMDEYKTYCVAKED